MKIETMEEAEKELQDRIYKIRMLAKDKVPALDSVIKNLDGKLHLPNFVRVSYALGAGSVSTDIKVMFYHKAASCLLSARLYMLEDRIFFPYIASSFRTFDELIEMVSELDRISHNY